MENFPQQLLGGVPITQKTYDFYRTLHLQVQRFPKIERYATGQTLQNETLGLLKCLLAACETSGSVKAGHLGDASLQLETVKVFVRLAYDVRALDRRAYILLQEFLQEIGRMLGGWIKSTQKSNSEQSSTSKQSLSDKTETELIE